MLALTHVHTYNQHPLAVMMDGGDAHFSVLCVCLCRWYHEGLSRAAAEDMLKRIHYDGAFLVRHSGQDQCVYAISFRWANQRARSWVWDVATWVEYCVWKYSEMFAHSDPLPVSKLKMQENICMLSYFAVPYPYFTWSYLVIFLN